MSLLGSPVTLQYSLSSVGWT